jgi:hypothetical protein
LHTVAASCQHRAFGIPSQAAERGRLRGRLRPKSPSPAEIWDAAGQN